MSLLFKKFPPSQPNYYANLISLWRNKYKQKLLIWVDSSVLPFKVPLLSLGSTTLPLAVRKTLTFVPPPLKRRKTVSRRCSCTFEISFILASWLIQWAPFKAIQITDNSSNALFNGYLPTQNQLMSDKMSTGVCMKNLLEPHLHTILQLVEMWQAPPLVLGNLLCPLFLESFPIDSVVISNVRDMAQCILAKRQSSTNKEDSGTKSVIAPPSDYLQLGGFVKAIASGAVTTSKSPALDESPPPFIEMASRYANQLLSKILNEGIKDATLIERYLEALHQKGPGFTYKIVIASEGSICRYVWMTPAMTSRSFELWWCVIPWQDEV
jgi:hypothetical protein